MSFDVNRLYSLLPSLYRIRDVEAARRLGLDDDQGPLRALLAVIAEQVAVLENDLAQLYDDQFIETCNEWVIPSIGELVGTRNLFIFESARFNQRALVANTIRDRRRKGTAAGLEQLARDATGWPANAVEFFQFLATTQYMKHLRPGNLTMPDLRDRQRLEYLNTPFDSAARTAEVRRIASGRGKYNIPNIGLFLWRLGANSITNAPAFRLDTHRFLFHALGKPAVLVTSPAPIETVSQLSTPLDVPIPISRRVLSQRLSSYYPKSIAITLNGVPVDVSDVQACNLSDTSPGVWAQTPGAKYLVDTELGRLLAPAAVGPADVVRVTYHYGFSDEMGGGEYSRLSTFTPRLAPAIGVRSPATIQGALSGFGNGVIEVQDNEVYAENPAIHAANGQTVELRAKDRQRPVILLSGDLLVTGDEESAAVLNGFWISGGTVRVPLLDSTGAANRLRVLRLKHCTLAPSSAPSLVIEAPNVTVEIEECILGSVRAPDVASVSIGGSIVDALGEANAAYSGLLGYDAGAPLTIENSTVIGKVHTQTMVSASNTIFLAALGEFDFWLAPVIAERLQEGCVRYSFAPPGSRLPRQFQCQPQDAEDAARVRPVFTSLQFGDAGYCQLSLHCAAEIRQGADDQAEMGAFHDLFEPQRISNLRTRLDEYLRFGLEAGIFLAS